MSDSFNIHEPIYYNIEKEVANLSYSICFDDDQLDVYSPQIAELILRIAVEVEAISIELYQKHCTDPKKNISYSKAIEALDTKFKLGEIPILISSESSYFSDDERISFPFRDWYKWEHEKNGDLVLGCWHCAYQILKHNDLNDKYLTMKRYGTLRFLLMIASALFLLNFICSGSGRFALNSKLFSIVHINENGEYGIRARSYPGKYLPLDESLIEILKK